MKQDRHFHPLVPATAGTAAVRRGMRSVQPDFAGAAMSEN
jgi:hypothetical protein